MILQHDNVPDPTLRGKTVKVTTMLVDAKYHALFRETSERVLSASG